MNKLILCYFFATLAFAQVKDVAVRQLVSLTFAQVTAISGPPNGMILYCSDCTAANPTAGGGTGAVVRRENGQWNGGSGGGGSSVVRLPIPLTPTPTQLGPNNIDSGGAGFMNLAFAQDTVFTHNWQTLNVGYTSANIQLIFASPGGVGGLADMVLTVYCWPIANRAGIVPALTTRTANLTLSTQFYLPILPTFSTVSLSSCNANDILSFKLARAAGGSVDSVLFLGGIISYQ